MKAFGVFILIVGVVVVFLSLTMDTSVATGYGQRVNNLGLMRDQQNYLIFGSVCFLGGLLATILGKSKSATRNEIDCPFCAEKILSIAKVCKHCGKDVTVCFTEETATKDDGYQFLRYENNNLTLNKYDIKRFADSLSKRMPGQSSEFIIHTNLDEINKLKSSMPESYAAEFYEILVFFLSREKNNN